MLFEEGVRGLGKCRRGRSAVSSSSAPRIRSAPTRWSSAGNARVYASLPHAVRSLLTGRKVGAKDVDSYRRSRLADSLRDLVGNLGTTALADVATARRTFVRLTGTARLNSHEKTGELLVEVEMTTARHLSEIGPFVSLVAEARYQHSTSPECSVT